MSARVALLMGSNSDLPKLQACIDTLKGLGVECEVRVMSAHRTPEIVSEFASQAEQRGLEVIMAAAGGAVAELYV